MAHCVCYAVVYNAAFVICNLKIAPSHFVLGEHALQAESSPLGKRIKCSFRVTGYSDLLGGEVRTICYDSVINSVALVMHGRMTVQK